MAPDAAATGTVEACEAMGSVDGDQFVVADPNRDGVWVAAPLADATTLADWR
jgi:hypothetical protein